MTKPKVIAFDLFGTVFDLAGVDRDEIRCYFARACQPEWQPLELPESWYELRPFPDSVEGIGRLRKSGIKVGTLSNAPAHLARSLSVKAGIEWDFITPLEIYKVYKPDERAYLAVLYKAGCQADEMMMVTANETFAHYSYGDIHVARNLGMQSRLIRTPELPTILALAGEVEGM